MKKIFNLIAILVTVFTTTVTAQDSAFNNKAGALLVHYYNLKNALVAGDAGSAASNADLFIRAANTIDYKLIPEGNINALLNDATRISVTKDLKKQRLYFANFSANMIAIAKSVKLTAAPLYEAYCPMKKASWLSAEKEIRNPYYGSAMLTCGKIIETIDPEK
jgi:hypothetical protein